MSLNVEHLPRPVAKALKAYARRKRVYQLARIAAAVIALYGVLLLAAAHVDRFAFLPGAGRWTLFVVIHIAALAAAVAAAVWYVFRRPSTRRIAYELEARMGGTDERFVTLESVLRPGAAVGDNEPSRKLLDQLRESTERLTRDLHPGRLVRDRAARRGVTALAVVVLAHGLLFAVPGYQYPLMLERVLQPGEPLPRASFIRITTSPASEEGPLTVKEGGELTLRAQVENTVPSGLRWLQSLLGAAPDGCELVLRGGGGGEGAPRVLAMTRIRRDKYLFARSSLDESFRFAVQSGNMRTAPRQVRVVPPPRVVGIGVEVTPPDYARLESRTLRDPEGAVEALKGSQLEVTFRVDKETAKRRLKRADLEKPADITWDAESRTARHAFTLSDSTELTFAVEDRFGFTNPRPAKLRVRVREDQAPAIELTRPASEVRSVAAGLVEIVGRVEDDLGLKNVSISYRVNPDASQAGLPETTSVPLPEDEEGPIRSHELAHRFDLKNTAAAPGDTVLLRVRASDSGGNDAQSRPIRVRIVPFTRGVHEQQRIAALRALGVAIDAAAEAETPKGIALGAALPPSILEQLREAGRAQALGLGEDPTWGTLFERLRLEHGKTRDPLDQRDLRRLRVVLHAALALPGAISGDDPASRLGARIVPGLADGRSARNLIWRLTGMSREALRIRKRLAELENTGGEAALAALNRRASLYLETTQELGRELIELAKRTPGIDAETVSQAMAEINTQGYFLTNGGLPRRQRAAEAVAGHIRKAVERLRGALAPLMEREAEARSALAGLYERAFRDVAGRAGESGAAFEVLHADWRLLHQNPFAGLWPKLRAAAALARIDRDGARGTGSAATWAPPAALESAVGREREVSRGLTLRWHRWRIGRLDRVPGRERALEQVLLRWERALAAGDAERTKQWRGRADGISLFGDAKRTAKAPEPPPMPNPRQAERALAGEARRALGLAPVADHLERLIAAVEESVAARERVAAAFGEGEAAQGAARQLRDALGRMERRLDLALVAIRLRLALLPGGPDDGSVADANLLALTESAARFRARTARLRASLEGLDGAGESGSGGLLNLQSELSGLQAQQKAVIGKAKERLAASKEATTQPASGVPEVLEATRRLARFSLREEPGREGARTFLREYEGAAAILIGAQRARLAAAGGVLEALGERLEREKPGAEAVAEAVSRVLRALEGLERTLGSLGDAPAGKRVSGRLAEAQGRVQALAVDGSAALTSEQISELRFAHQEAVDAFTRLLTTVDTVAADSGLALSVAEEWPAQVRRRLRGVGELAERQAVLGATVALRDGAGAAAEAYAWAALLHRLLRAPMALPGAERAPTEGGERVEDPLLAFLRRELREARKKKDLGDYEKVSEQYLKLVGDYLRY